MNQTQAGALMHQLRKITSEPATDRELLQRFADQRDEFAFTALVERHGPMVLRVCSRLLRNRHDAEDVCQAVFLVLASKAASRYWQPTVAGWLHQVAYHLAQKANAAALRRANHERNTSYQPSPSPLETIAGQELRDALNEELACLPEKYRTPLLLCYLAGSTRDQAAVQLGCPLSTLKSRVERGCELLRNQLSCRGFTLASALTAVTLSDNPAFGAVAESLWKRIGHGALLFAEGKTAAAEVVSVRVLSLAGAGLKSMALVNRKIAAALVLAMSAFFGGAGGVALRSLEAEPVAAAAAPQASESASKAKNAAKSEQRERNDMYGDPLPEGAVARLGTTRLRHGGFAGFVRFSADGKTLISRADDGVRIWDTTTGMQIYVMGKETAGGGGRQASLTSDGKLLAISNDSGIYLCDVAAARVIRTLIEGRYHSVAFSPNGKVLAALAAGDSNHVELLEVSTGRQLWASSPEKQPLACVAFAPNGKTVIVAGWRVHRIPPLMGHTIRGLDAETGKEQWQIDLGTINPHRIAVSADGSRLAAIYTPDNPNTQERSQLSVWDLANRKELHRLKPPTKEGTIRQRYFSALTFAPDGKSLVTAGGEESLVVWDLLTGKERRRLGQNITNAGDLAFSPNGMALAVAGPGAIIRVIDASKGEELVTAIGHQLPVNTTAITPDSRTVVTADASGAFVWDPATGRARNRLESGGFAAQYHLSSDGQTAFLTEYYETTLKVWDVQKNKERTRLSSEFPPVILVSTTNGKRLAVRNYTGDTVHVLDATEGKLLRSIKDVGLSVRSAEFTADGKNLIFFCDDHTAQVWDIARGTKLRQFGPMGESHLRAAPPMPRGGGGGLSYAAAQSPDGQWVAYGSQNGYLVLFDATTGQEVRRLDDLKGGAGKFAFSPDGRTLAWSGWRDPDIHLLELATGKERHSFVGHRGPVYSLSFSVDAKLLVSGGSDTTALVWDLTGRLWDKPPNASLNLTELDACWADLSRDDAARAFQATRRLAAASAAAMPFLKTKLPPLPAIDNKRLASLVADLDSNTFAVRTNAAKELEELGEVAADYLQKALAGKPSLEVAARLKTILAKQAQAWHLPSPAEIRKLRAMEALELAGTPAARQVLEQIAAGAAGSRITQEAKLALERLARRPRIFSD